MADPSQAAAAQTAAALAKFPSCVQKAAAEVLAKTPCNADIVCVCEKIGFGFIPLLSEISAVSGCTPADIGAALQIVPQICTDAVPSLKNSRARETIIVITTIWVLAIVAVILRLMSRKLSNARFGLDDYLIVFGMISSSGLSLASIFTVHYGAGRHMVLLTLDQITGFSKSSFYAQLMFGVSITATKLSLLFFYHRIFPIRTVTIISTITGVVMICWCITLLFLVIFSCRPISYYWNKSIPNGHCVNSNTVFISLAAFNIATDVVVLVLPMRWLAGLQLNLTKRLAVIATFILGGFVCVVGLLRIPFILEFNVIDATWSVIHLSIWINVECSVGIVCACLPVMRTLINRLYPVLFRSRLSQTRVGYNSQKGSQRLTDEENSRISQKMTVTSAVGGVGIPPKSMDRGGLKGKSAWFSNKRPTKNDDEMTGSMEEMVPVGNITVQHDIEWVNAPLDKP